MQNRIKITWKVSDGYVGHGPHSFYIDQEDFEDFENEDERQQFIEECVQQEFENEVSWEISSIEDIKIDEETDD